MKLYAQAQPSEGLYGDGEEGCGAASLRTPGGTWPASSAPREGPRLLKPLGAPPALASRDGEVQRPQGSLLGSENVMSGTRRGVVSGGTCPCPRAST